MTATARIELVVWTVLCFVMALVCLVDLLTAPAFLLVVFWGVISFMWWIMALGGVCQLRNPKSRLWG